MDTSPESPIYALLGELNRLIAEAEVKLHEDMERLRDYPEAQKRERWERFHAELRPVRQKRENLIQRLAYIEGLKPPPPIFIDSADWTGHPYKHAPVNRIIRADSGRADLADD